MKTALIFCAGSAERYEGETRKQLVVPEPEESGTVLLIRTIEQLSDRGCRVVVVANKDFRLPCAVASLDPGPKSRWWVETALATRVEWPDTTGLMMMLGDVWYSDELVDEMVRHAGTNELRFFGRQDASPLTGCGAGEVWGITCDPRKYPALLEGLEAALEDAEAGDAGRPGYMIGSPWQPYRHLIGVPLGQHCIGGCGLWQEWSDWTEDFDRVSDLEMWRARRKRRWVGGGL